MSLTLNMAFFQAFWRVVIDHTKSFTPSWPRLRCSFVSSKSALLSAIRMRALLSLMTVLTRYESLGLYNPLRNASHAFIQIRGPTRFKKNMFQLCCLLFRFSQLKYQSFHLVQLHISNNNCFYSVSAFTRLTKSYHFQLNSMRLAKSMWKYKAQGSAYSLICENSKGKCCHY